MHAPATQKHPRFQVRRPIHVVTATAQIEELALENISLGGVFIKTSNPVPLGSELRLRLAPNEGKLAIGLVGRVVHVIDERSSAMKAHPPGMGVRFEKLTPQTEATLKNFLEALALTAKAKNEEPHRPPAHFLDTYTVQVSGERAVLQELWSSSLKHGGVFAEGNAPVLGTRVRVILGSLDLAGEVVHVQAGKGAGLQIFGLDGKRLEAIQAYLAGTTDLLYVMEDKLEGAPLGKVLAAARRLFLGLEEKNGFGAIGLPTTATEGDVIRRADLLRRIFQARPRNATHPQIARIEAAGRALDRLEPELLARVSALRMEAELVLADADGSKSRAQRQEQVKTLVAEAFSKELINQYSEARKLLERALEIDPLHPVARKRLDNVNSVVDSTRAADLLRAAEVFIQNVGMKEEALRNAREAARLSELRDVRLRALRIFAKAGETAEALLMAEELVEKNPKDPLALQAVMHLSEKNYQWSSAVKAGEALMKLKPGDAGVLERLRRVNDRLRQTRR